MAVGDADGGEDAGMGRGESGTGQGDKVGQTEWAETNQVMMEKELGIDLWI